ncbi:MAG TPA: PA2169 family four-helix-bundle protein [Nevskiaceae bacterium]|nr:PA2169 family four-helix-bundle protein [Nevskiaceae bacterium]
MSNTEAIKVLNDLVETSEDGKNGFAAASERATDGQLKALFREYAEDCGRALGELQESIRNLGGTPPDHGTVAGAAHRGWTKVKSMIEESNAAVLEEVERGEDHAKAVYAKALKAELPPLIRAMVEKQRDGVLRHHDRVRELRNQYRGKP